MSGHLSKRKIVFALSVDVEEEFDWAGPFPQQDCSVENVKQIPAFHAFCESLGIRPTYLVDYPVAVNPDSAAIMRDVLNTGNAEIGAHLHPWCTPPFVGENTERESHVVNLPPELVRQKLDTLTSAIENNIGIRPVSFRTGRWGINAQILKLLVEAGYTVDSSVYPYYRNEYFSCLESPDQPYWPSLQNSDLVGIQDELFEFPVTAGFNRTNFPVWNRVHQKLSSPFGRALRAVGFASRTHLLRKIYLSPELSSAQEMIKLMQAALNSGHTVIHLFLHSSTLMPGFNTYTRTQQDVTSVYAAISKSLGYLSGEVDINFCTFSEAAEGYRGVLC